MFWLLQRIEFLLYIKDSKLMPDNQFSNIFIEKLTRKESLNYKLHFLILHKN